MSTYARAVESRLFALDWNIEQAALAIDEQQRKVGGAERFGKPLKCGKIGDRLAIEFQEKVAGLKAGNFGQTAVFNVRDHEPGVDGQIHLPRQGRSDFIHDHT